MVKQLKNVIICPLFLIFLIGSIIAVVIYYFNYTNSKYEQHYKYSINYHENINDYDDEINTYKELLNTLPVKEKNYDLIKKHYEDTIKIYEHLKIDNVDYMLVCDNISISEFDRTVFIANSKNVLFPIILINLAVIIYLIFTREFDNSRYVFIYGEKRISIIKNKILLSFMLSISLFLLYFLLIYIFSSKFDSTYKYVLAIDSTVEFISSDSYIVKYVFIYSLFNLLFFFTFFWGISLIARKSVITSISAIIVVGIFALLAKFTDVSHYLGLMIDFEIVSHNLYFLTNLSIFIPITLLLYGVIHFEKSDL